MSIPGIGPVLASGILSEIGTITTFNSHKALAKYTGLTWHVNQSGDFSAQDTNMSKNQIYSSNKGDAFIHPIICVPFSRLCLKIFFCL